MAIKIIKEGHIEKQETDYSKYLKTTFLFRCTYCGCVWEASGSDCYIEAVSGGSVRCNCPTCNATMILANRIR